MNWVKYAQVGTMQQRRESKTNPGFLSKSPPDSSDVCCLELDLKSLDQLFNFRLT